MNDNLPINMDEQETGGSISYANEVIAIIAGMAMSEVDGVAGKAAAKSVSEYFGIGKSSKAVAPVTKGVRVEVGSEEASVDLTLGVEYGKPIQKVCTEVQENVRKAIETMTGLHVVKVDVHVTSVIFEKDEQADAALLAQAPAAPAVPEKTAAPEKPTAPAAPVEKAPEKAPESEPEPTDDPDMENDLDIDIEIEEEEASEQEPSEPECETGEE